MTTLKDISKALNLSVTTVSRALNGFPEVNAQTRELVVHTATLMNYHPNQFARKLVTGHSGMVGLVQQTSPDLYSNPCFLEVITGISQHLARHKTHFILQVSTEPDVMPTYRDMVARHILDGFVITGPTTVDQRITFLLENNIPFVVHGRNADHAQYAFYDIDNYRVGYDLTQHLLELGHKHIAFLNGPAHMAFAQERYSGFTTALAEYGLLPNPELVRHEPMLTHFGVNAAQALLGNSKIKPTAFVCSNTLIAAGVVTALQQAGQRIPEAISVVAHDDNIQGWQTAHELVLTATYAPLSDACQPLADYLIRRIAGEPLVHLQQIVHAPLHCHGSSGLCPI